MSLSGSKTAEFVLRDERQLAEIRIHFTGGGGGQHHRHEIRENNSLSLFPVWFFYGEGGWKLGRMIGEKQFNKHPEKVRDRVGEQSKKQVFPGHWEYPLHILFLLELTSISPLPKIGNNYGNLIISER